MPTPGIRITSRFGDFFVHHGGGRFFVTSKDAEDMPLARLAQNAALSAFRSEYTPAAGEPVAFFSKAAAAYLRGKVVGDIPPGAGELEQAE